MRRLIALLLPLTLSCAGLGTHDATGAPGCARIETAYQAWGAVAAMSTTLSASGAIASIPVEDKDGRILLSLSSVALVGLAASAIYLRDALSQEYGEHCELLSPVATSTISATLTQPHR